jgi:hypothetical protein
MSAAETKIVIQRSSAFYFVRSINSWHVMQ